MHLFTKVGSGEVYLSEACSEAGSEDEGDDDDNGEQDAGEDDDEDEEEEEPETEVSIFFLSLPHKYLKGFQ